MQPPLPTTTTEKSHNKASGGVMCLAITDTRGFRLHRCQVNYTH